MFLKVKYVNVNLISNVFLVGARRTDIDVYLKRLGS